MVFSALVSMVLAPYLNAPMAWLFPTLQAPTFTDQSQLVTPAFKGQWWLLGIVLLSHLLNYFLGEEFLFRGVLLPRMRGVFGKYDWAANSVLFGFYHVHKPWMIPTIMLSSVAYTFPPRRFRSNWMAVIVHGVEGLPSLVIVLAVVLGLVTG